MANQWIDIAVLTIFARECLEGSVIIGEYRTLIFRGDDSLAPGITKQAALREITKSALFATALALVVIACVAVPLLVFSRTLNPFVAEIIEGVSKIVASVCLLQLSLKVPKMLGVYGSLKKKKKFSKCRTVCLWPWQGKNELSLPPDNTPIRDGEDNDNFPGENSEHEEEACSDQLTLLSIRFNVAWNIWREVAECGVFLIPIFLSGDHASAIPLSAVAGAFIGLALGLGIYYANNHVKERKALAVFVVLLLTVFSAGLFVGGVHGIESELGSTTQVWKIQGDFWNAEQLPMTLLTPFGYDDSRTVLEICCYWGWLSLAAALHYRKYKISPKLEQDKAAQEDDIQAGKECSALSASSYSLPPDTVRNSRESSVEEGPSGPALYVETIEDIEADLAETSI